MRFSRKFAGAIIASACLGLAACDGDDGEDGVDGMDGPAGAPGTPGLPGTDGVDATDGAISLRKIGSFRNPAAEFDESAAEIVAYDASTSQLFVVNAQSGSVDVIDLASPSTPTLNTSLDVAGDVATARSIATDALGAANSVSVNGGVLAVAIEADPKTDPGFVAFYQTDGTFLAAVEVGALPDMVTFTPDGSFAITANEGEPNDDYSIDPMGTISLIDLAGGASAVLDGNVNTLDLSEFNEGGPRNGELDSKIRLSRPFGASVAQDVEPEYVAVSADSSTAWVSLQENSAFVEVDIAGGSIASVWGTGTKDFSLPGNELDASNDDGIIFINNWPVQGLLMPDSIATYRYNGRNYLLTANEGDGREYIADVADAGACTRGLADFDDGECLVYLDEIRIKDIVDPSEVGATIDSDAANQFVHSQFDLDSNGIVELFEDENIGRLKVISTEGLDDPSCLNDGGQPTAACEYAELIAYGGRSFSIFDADSRSLVYDSGSDFEVITAERLGLAGGFNASNDDNEGDDRSDDKGPEPEAIALGSLKGRTYAFIGLERVGGIMVYNVSEPESPKFVQYINSRDFSQDPQNPDDSYNEAAGDLGPEGIVFVPASDSANGNALLLVGNEVSGTTAIFQIDEVEFTD